MAESAKARVPETAASISWLASVLSNCRRILVVNCRRWGVCVHYEQAQVWKAFAPLAAAILKAKPTPFHNALAAGVRGGWVEHVFTTNVDGLEQAAGIPLTTSLSCVHGSLTNEIFCLQHNRQPVRPALEMCAKGEVPTCACGLQLILPIVMFGGHVMVSRWAFAARARRVDCVLWVGTALEVAPVAFWPNQVNPETKQVFINSSAPPDRVVGRMTWVRATADEAAQAMVVAMRTRKLLKQLEPASDHRERETKAP